MRRKNFTAAGLRKMIAAGQLPPQPAIPELAGKPPDKKPTAPKFSRGGPGKFHIEAALDGTGLPYEREYRFAAAQGRKYRFDWAVPSMKLAVEYEGIFSAKSRHTTHSGYSEDANKYNLAASLGWRVLRYTAKNYWNIEADLQNFVT